MPLRRRNDTTTTGEPGRLAMPRTRGATSGLLLVLLGLWGGLVPFIGPYFDLSVGNDRTWDFTAGRFWLSLLPAAATVLGGLLLIRSANRATASFGAWAAIAGGAWFVVGPVFSMLWNDGTPQTGPALGGTNHQVLEWLTYYYGLGALIATLGGIALGRVTSRLAGDTERLTGSHEVATRNGRFTRERDSEKESLRM